MQKEYKEYIEREEAKELFRMWITDCVLAGDNDAADCFRDCIDLLDSIPAADVAPVVHGRWIEQEKYTFGVMYDCSICDNRILDNGHSWNYCPNCGAKMDKEVADDKKQPEEAPGE